MGRKRCVVYQKLLCVIYSRQNFASREWNLGVSYLLTEETSGRKISYRGLCAISQGVYHPTVV